MPVFTGMTLGLIWMAMAISIVFPSVLLAAFSSKSAGTSGAAFLKIGAGARPTAMGGAYTGIADDVNAINWNAAGLSLIREKNEFVAMRAELFQEIQYNFFAFAHPMGDYGTIGVGLANLNITGIEQRSADTDTPDSTFASNDSAYTLAYGRKLMENLHLGIAGKAIRQTLAGEAANTFAADLGALYQFPDMPLTAGLAIQNMGASQKFKSEADPLPLTIKAGSAYRIGQDWAISGVSTEQNKTGLLMALDLHSPRDNDPSIRTGMEFTHGWSEMTLTSVRAGYETGRNRQVEGMGSGVSAGAGVTYKFFTFDFAWVPYGNLGNTFRYSIKLRF